MNVRLKSPTVFQEEGVRIYLDCLGNKAAKMLGNHSTSIIGTLTKLVQPAPKWCDAETTKIGLDSFRSCISSSKFFSLWIPYIILASNPGVENLSWHIVLAHQR